MDPWGLYSEAHYYVTFIESINAGFNFKDSATIAKANQRVDESMLTRAWPLPSFGGWLHFMSRGDAEKYMDTAISTKNLKECGKALHLYQDTYSHAGYKFYKGGHVLDSKKGINPDLYRPNHSRDIEMRIKTYNYLKQIKDSLR